MTAVTPRRTIDELRARVTDKGPWFDVPAETRPMCCRSCGAAVYFITTPAGKPMPVDVLVRGGLVPRARRLVPNDHGTASPTEERNGRGVSHFATCPDSPMWKKSHG